VNLNQGSRTNSHKDHLSNRDGEEDYPHSNTAFGNRETNSSFTKGPLAGANTAINWFEMYNKDQTKHIKIKKRRRVKKVKKEEVPDTV
jgi:hypothetical protein